jgi:hypothetical protein
MSMGHIRPMWLSRHDTRMEDGWRAEPKIVELARELTRQNGINVSEARLAIVDIEFV